MRVNILFIAVFAAIIFNACNTTGLVLSSASNDDVFWSSKLEPKPILDEDNRNTDNLAWQNKTPQQFTPIEKYEEPDISKQNEAYNEWNRRRAYQTDAQTEQDNAQVIKEQQQQEEETNARRFGSNRNYYYDDPFYNSLSTNWGWTNLYNPIIRPGFYNWAPGWNIGLSWNSFNGWNTGIGYNLWGPSWQWGWGFNNFGFYNSWCGFGCNPWYNPWHPFGFYDPFWGPGWGWNHFNNPYWGWPYGRNNFYNNNDAVINRPLLRPRSGGVNNGGGSSLPPRGRIGSDPNITNPAIANPKPEQQRSRPNINNEIQRTNRPGGDLVPDKNGNPEYVQPRTRPSINNNVPQFQNQANPGQRYDRDLPASPGNRGYETPQNNPPDMRREAPAQPRQNQQMYSPPAPRSNFNAPRGGGYSPSGGGGSAPRSRPR